MILVMSVLVYAICFLYKSPVVPQMSHNRDTQLHLVSPFTFSYTSEVQTQLKRDRIAERIPPLYRINESSISNAEGALNKLISFLNENQPAYDALSDKKDNEFFDKLSSNLRKRTLISVNPSDLRTVYEHTTLKNRFSAFNHAFFHVENIIKNGIYEDNDAIFSINPDDDASPASRIEGTDFNARAMSETEAQRALLSRIKTLGANENLALALYRMLNQNLRPNIEFDEEKTKAKRMEAASRVDPVVIKVREGETIVDSNSPSTPLIAEKIKAFKKELEARGGSVNIGNYIDFVASFLLVLTATFFIIISKTQKNKQPRTVAIFCTLLLLNLLVERLVIHLSNAEYFDTNTTLLQILAYGTPLMLGPIIQVLLFGSYTGFLMAILIAFLTTMMLGESVFFCLLFLSAALVAIYFCDGATKRSRVILGGLIYGLFIAFFAFNFGEVAGVADDKIWRQSSVALATGAITGILATAVLPVIELIFNRYSNITLLDYTDFNNPLLRRLQIEAPGTYHHSVMVSYLAEAAAAAINANPMVCRIGALYHDIGKLVKPEFFSENQSGRRNLHDDQNPSMSALIIKNHIKEGVELARASKLPKQVIDAIIEHHGTSMIAYFYNKAVKSAESAATCDPARALREEGVDESTYRHEGVKPRTVENAIIMLADSCEAASRSLKKITKHGVEDLVNSIVRTKMNDGQLDECPITVKQLAKIRQSFVFTMLNMLHTRIAYNNDKK